jgi:hypothetical protein
MNKRGAYFFVLDAFIGAAIFLITTVLIMGSYMNKPDIRQSHTLADDTMSYIINTRVRDYADPYVIKLVNNGNITNLDITLYSQILEFHYTNHAELATNFTKNILETLWETHYGVSYNIIEEDGSSTIIYNRSTERINNSRFLLSSKRLAFYKLNETTYFGPSIAEVKVWG